MRAWNTRVSYPVLRQQRNWFSSSCMRLERPHVPSNEALLEVLDALDGKDHSVGEDGHTSTEPDSKSIGQLPPSPLTDPALNAARFGHKKAKAPPKQERLSEFQLKLQKNPFAHALATSPRHCRLTGARLPSYFLAKFGLAIHPETGQQWHLPNLAADVAAADAQEPVQEVSATDVEGEVSLDAKKGVEAPAPLGPPRALSGTHFLASHTALSYISRLSPTNYRSLLPYRWREDGAVKVKDLVWREDMADFTLELMRKQAVRQIVRLAHGKGAMYLVPCDDWEDVEKKSQVGAVLWSGGSSENTPGEPEEGAEALEPPLYATVDNHGKQIPVYNLHTLLGKRCLDDLKLQLPRTLLVALKAKRMTVKLQLWLWKLTGYLAH